ncbi:hypothetical protein B0H16DRAFT_1694627 [Mycena metata]|uniref:Uncharacterized protein n=1 Tax=Mycena metata TaxID=1033252 RepID=A0AAD7IAV0_9AGAR|nr:hypothetical protein B0H16DRAFT_1694627 [Mycena metata]
MYKSMETANVYQDLRRDIRSIGIYPETPALSSGPALYHRKPRFQMKERKKTYYNHPLTAHSHTKSKTRSSTLTPSLYATYGRRVKYEKPHPRTASPIVGMPTASARGRRNDGAVTNSPTGSSIRKKQKWSEAKEVKSRMGSNAAWPVNYTIGMHHWDADAEGRWASGDVLTQTLSLKSLCLSSNAHSLEEQHTQGYLSAKSCFAALSPPDVRLSPTELLNLPVHVLNLVPRPGGANTICFWRLCDLVTGRSQGFKGFGGFWCSISRASSPKGSLGEIWFGWALGQLFVLSCFTWKPMQVYFGFILMLTDYSSD